ncbi:hypothetical protein BDF14DRAFT_1756752 [Spinellus fusiger]|nr:hypothetical protein BDF14DRAFT_1756752 [Spinellus fusiger]
MVTSIKRALYQSLFSSFYVKASFVPFLYLFFFHLLIHWSIMPSAVLLSKHTIENTVTDETTYIYTLKEHWKKLIDTSYVYCENTLVTLEYLWQFSEFRLLTAVFGVLFIVPVSIFLLYTVLTLLAITCIVCLLWIIIVPLALTIGVLVLMPFFLTAAVSSIGLVISYQLWIYTNHRLQNVIPKDVL